MKVSSLINKKSFIELNEKDQIDILSNLNEKKYRLSQINNWVFKNHVSNWREMKNFPLSLIEKLEKTNSLYPLKIIANSKADDSMTQKFIMQTMKGNKIESVLMPTKKRNTVCISSQSGCALDCKFCATASLGFLQNLNEAEIINQIIYLQKISNKRISNVVFMGMGEPFLNYKNVIKAACRIKDIFNIGSRKITISTAGIASKIKQIADDNYKFKLAISMNASTNEIRKKIMPITKKYPIQDLISSAHYYYEKIRRFITFEYVLLKDINDTVDDAKRLANHLKFLPCKLNIIPYNEIDGAYKRPSNQVINAFVNELSNYSFIVTVRWSKGTSIEAGCGQLALKT